MLPWATSWQLLRGRESATRLRLREERGLPKPQAIHPVNCEGPQRPETVPHAPLEVDAARLGKVTHRYRDIAQAEAEANSLDQQLRIEDEVIRVSFKWNAFQHRTAIDSETAVEITEVLSQRDVLDSGQEPVAQVLV